MTFIFKPVDQADVEQLVCWQYDPPYDIYSLGGPFDDEYLAYFLDPQNKFHSIKNQAGRLLAFCSFGLDAQVPGGDYQADALDIGMGVHPDLTGQGRGIYFAQAVLGFAQQKFASNTYRVTIADFNKRARRVWEKAGFHYIHTFD
ncbi:MAG: GNAT family protein, partial [Chloroflexota bacterium]